MPLPTETFVLPKYPPIAELTGTEGKVSLKVEVDLNGNPTNLVVESGYPLLGNALNDAVSQWRFPKQYAGQQVEVTLEFDLNCPNKAK
jgi:TonB family protein